MKLLISAAALLFAAPAFSQAAPSPSIAELVAQGMQSDLPKPLDNGLVMTEVAAEDGTLVVLVEDRENFTAAMPAAVVTQEMVKGLAQGFCRDRTLADQMIAHGFKMRAELLVADGGRIRSAVIDRCPD